MQYIVIILIPLFCLMGFLHIWRIESRNAIILTPFMVLVINEFIRVMPAFVYAAFVHISDIYPLIIFFVSYVMVIAGFLVAISDSEYRSGLPRQFVQKKIDPINERKAFLLICLLSIFLIFVGLILYQGVPSILGGFVALLKGEAIEEVAVAIGSTRKEITKSYYFGGIYRGQGLLRTVLSYWWPFVISLSLIIYLKKKRKQWFLVTIILLIISFIFIAGDGTRANFVKTILIYIILYSYIKQLTFRYMLGGFLLIVIISIFMSLYSPKMLFIIEHDNFIINAFLKILGRIFIGNSINDVFAIDFVRDRVIEHRMGALHLRDLIAAVPGPHGGTPFAHELYLLLNPSARGTTYATGTYITKVYVDFGIIGVAIIYFMIGFIVGVCQKKVFKLNKNPLNLILITVCSYYFGFMVLIGPISSCIGLGFSAVLFLSLRFALKKKKKFFPSQVYLARSDV